MDSKEALGKIKETELATGELIEKAKQEARKLLHEAGLERERIIKHDQVQAMLDAQKLKEKMQAEAFKEIAVIESQAKNEIDGVKKKAQANIDKAADFMRRKIEEHGDK